MAPSTAFVTAEKDRNGIQDQLNFLETELLAHPTTALSRIEVETYLGEVAEVKKQVVENHKKIWATAPTGIDMAPYITEYQKLAKMASRIHSGFHGILMGLPTPATASTSTATTAASSSSQSIKLPRLELPKFGGNLQEWVSFRDMFVTAIDKSSLTKVEKLTQLKSLLTGEASRQIRSLVLSEANYDIAWKALTDRYENSRELFFAILKRLYSQPALSVSSATAMRSLVDTTKECIRSLEVLALPTQHWDGILLYLLFTKLDPASKELWEQSLPDTKIPSLDKMYDFIEQRARALAASGGAAPPPPPARQGKPQQQPSRIHHMSAATCKLGCSESHPLFRCSQFQRLDPDKRLDQVNKIKACRNCLWSGHHANACPSTRTCKVCSEKHHTMLHPNGSTVVGRQIFHPPGTPSAQPQQSGGQPTVQSHHNYVQPYPLIPTGILATARVIIKSTEGDSVRRSLVDCGSTNTQVMKRTAKKLRLPLYPVEIPMTGSQEVFCGVSRYVTTFTFTPWFNPSIALSVTALVVDKISGHIPSQRLKKEEWHHLDGLQLADPDFHVPGEVEILFGTDIVWSMLENEKRDGAPDQPSGIKTTLGWLVGGANALSITTLARTYTMTASIEEEIRRFIEQEEGPDEPCQSIEEKQCEDHFARTHHRDPTGRFHVRLPFKTPKPELGASRQAAVRRFLSLEQKYNNSKITDLEKLKTLQQQWDGYKEFMTEYLSMNHMELVPQDEIYSPDSYYIPHHAVFKESSTTTKLRVVFDASAATSNGTSLNQCLMIGPQLQDHIWDIMMRFRLHPIAFTADVAKMFRNIMVSPEDANYQRIVWRDHPSKPLRDYRLLTVTYGTGCAPYVAVKCLRQLAKDGKVRYPKASDVALRNFYVDDLASTSPTVIDAKETVQQLINLFMSGGMELRKWTTNNQELLESIPIELRETSSLVDLYKDTTVKTLGIYWNPSDDNYSFRLSLPSDMAGKSKREILSEIAMIYDPLGWLAPAIIVCKIFMQDLWKIKHSWDEQLPTSVQQQWSDIRASLGLIEQISIPRCVLPASPSKLFLFGACDASTKAISACIYLAAEYSSGLASCHLLTAKTKVAPVKAVTLPRLELNGALLLSKLIKATVKSLSLKFDELRAFTDSTIALHWIKSAPSRWKLYIKNRVQTIQENAPNTRWFHIPGEKNPADCASRGISACDLKGHPLWWNGTSYFFSPPDQISDLIDEDISQLEAESQVKSHHVQPAAVPEYLLKFSKFIRLQRVVAYLQRFIYNCRNPTESRCGSLNITELNNAHNYIMLELQKSCFPVEYNLLKKKQPFPSSSPLLNLQPFLGPEGLIRVGGRLRHANIAFDRKHPIILPRGHHITVSIVNDIHRQNFHSGPTATLAALQRQYWITNARDAVRAITRKCVTCSRHRAQLMTQVMGDLPPQRVNPSRAFSKAGVDYAGPFLIKPMVRSKVSLKCWLAIFVCLSTKAMHIEVVSSLSTDCFLAALRRFIARRGRPSDIFSDCGTNFKGADKALRDFFIVSRQNQIQDECTSKFITWHFNPPAAPHFGGLWEAGVKSIKHHLIRVIGSTTLTYEEMLTLVTQIEGILNSRPLVPASTDPSDFEALTPAHFLIGAPINAVPDPNLLDLKEGHLQRWQMLQQRQQLFWRRWSQEYLTRLQQRPKWMKISPDLQIGQMVIVKDERLPPLKWKLARVQAIYPGKDGHVRVATLKTAEGETTRPVVKLSPLPIK